MGLFNLGTETVVTKGLFNLNLEEKEPRGFLTLEPKPWWPKGFLTLILTKGNQGAFNLGTEAVATKGLYNFDMSCGD